MNAEVVLSLSHLLMIALSVWMYVVGQHYGVTPVNAFSMCGVLVVSLRVIALERVAKKD